MKKLQRGYGITYHRGRRLRTAQIELRITCANQDLPLYNPREA